MKLALHVNSPNGDSFRPQETVKGDLEIRDVELQKAPQITLTLASQVTADIQAKPGGANPGSVTDTIFKLQKEILVDELVSSRDENGELFYNFPFSIDFPSNPYTDNKSRTSQLPSSINITNSELSIRSEYVLLATVKRYVLKVPKSTSTRRLLPFISDPTDAPRPQQTTSLSLLSKQAQAASIGSKQGPPSYTEEGPTEGRRVNAQVLLPQSTVLVRGRDAPIGVEIRTPTQLLRTESVFIRKITINLLQTASIAVGQTTQKAVQLLHTCSTAGAIRITEETVRPDLGILANLSLYNARPSCVSRRLRVEHTLQVEVGISFGARSAIELLQSSIPMTVVDSPPEYQLSPADKDGFEYVQNGDEKLVKSPKGARSS